MSELLDCLNVGGRISVLLVCTLCWCVNEELSVK